MGGDETATEWEERVREDTRSLFQAAKKDQQSSLCFVYVAACNQIHTY